MFRKIRQTDGEKTQKYKGFICGCWRRCDKQQQNFLGIFFSVWFTEELQLSAPKHRQWTVEKVHRAAVCRHLTETGLVHSSCQISVLRRLNWFITTVSESWPDCSAAAITTNHLHASRQSGHLDLNLLSVFEIFQGLMPLWDVWRTQTTVNEETAWVNVPIPFHSFWNESQSSLFPRSSSFIHPAHHSSRPEIYFPRAAFSCRPVAYLVSGNRRGYRSTWPGGRLESVNMTLNPETNARHDSVSAEKESRVSSVNGCDHPSRPRLWSWRSNRWDWRWWRGSSLVTVSCFQTSPALPDMFAWVWYLSDHIWTRGRS